MVKKLITGTLFNIGNIIIQIVLGMLVFREMLLHFGENDFGVWSLLFAILAHIQLMEFGLGNFVSKLSPVVNKDNNRALFSTAFYSIFIIGSAFLAFLLIPFLFIEPSFDMKLAENGSITTLIFMLGASFVFNFQSGALHAYLTGKFKIGRLNLTRAFINILRAVLVIYLLNSGSDVGIIAFIFMGCSLLELVLLLTLSLQAGLRNDAKFALFSRLTFQHVVKRGSKFFFLSVNLYSRKNAAIIVCGALLGPIALVPLRIASRLMEIYTEISIALNYILTPYFSSISDDKDGKFANYFLTSIVCSSALSSLIFFNLFFLQEWFLVFWLTEVPQYTGDLLVILGLGYCFANAQGPCTSMLIAKNKNNQLMFNAILEVCLLLSLIVPMISHFGVLGAAYACFTSLFITRFLVQPFIIVKVLSISVFKYYLIVLIPILSFSLLTFSINLGMEKYLNELNGLANAFIFILLQGLILAPLAFIIFHKFRQASQKSTLA